MKRAIYLLDSNPEVLESLTPALQAAHYSVSCFSSARQMISQIEDEPACVIMELQLAHSDGFEILSLLQNRPVRIPVIVHSSINSIRCVVRAMKFGASEYIRKPASPPTILAAVSRVMASNSDQFSKKSSIAASKEALSRMSARDREIVYLLSRGLTNSDLAGYLNLSERTIEAHRLHISKKLGSNNPAGVSLLAFNAYGPGPISARGGLSTDTHADFQCHIDRAVMILHDAPEGSAFALLEQIDAPVYVTDKNGLLLYFNRPCVSFAGHRPIAGRDRWCVSWRLFSTDGKPIAHDASPMAMSIRMRKALRGSVVTAERPDGSRVSFLSNPTPIFDQRGEFFYAVNVLQPISDGASPETQMMSQGAII